MACSHRGGGRASMRRVRVAWFPQPQHAGRQSIKTKRRRCYNVEASPMGTMKVREVIRLLETDGWYLVRQRGSHR